MSNMPTDQEIAELYPLTATIRDEMKWWFDQSIEVDWSQFRRKHVPKRIFAAVQETCKDELPVWRNRIHWNLYPKDKVPALSLLHDVPQGLVQVSLGEYVLCIDYYDDETAEKLFPVLDILAHDTKKWYNCPVSQVYHL